jgi:endonuclease/exonuclease/phosphatase family metal-dependent hydrolase
MGRQLRVATYNIHGWVDEEHRSNLDRVAELVNQHDPDILCLQEVPPPAGTTAPRQVYPCWEQPCLLEFVRKTRFEFTLRWEGCAVLSKAGCKLQEFLPEQGYHTLLPKAPGFEFNRPRYLTARVQLEDRSEFYMTCIHLIPKYSELRHEEVVRIAHDLRPLFDQKAPQVWLGDFNTLRQADYSEDEWEEIVRIRRQNGRKAPLQDVMEELDCLGFQDNWRVAGCPEPRTTSRCGSPPC